MLLAVHLATSDGAQALKHLPALLAFFPGVIAGQAIASRRTVAGIRSDVAVLAIQLVLMSIVALLEASISGTAVTFLLSLASAMQNTVFKTANGMSYTSVVTTGNLRSATEYPFTGWSRRDGMHLRKAGHLGAVCAGFALGALSGAATTPEIGKSAMLVPMALIASALALCLVERRRATV